MGLGVGVGRGDVNVHVHVNTLKSWEQVEVMHRGLQLQLGAYSCRKPNNMSVH